MSTITDNFNRANAGSLGTSSEGWSWTDVVAGNSIVSNQCSFTGSTTVARSRAEFDLGSDNQWSQVTYTIGTVAAASQCGLVLRYSSVADSCYYFTMRQDGVSTRIIKVTAGALTTLVTATTTAPGAGSVLRFEAIGSQLTGYLNAVQMVTISDSTFTSGRAGAFLNAASGVTTTCDNFSAGTFATPSTLLTMGVG